MVAQPFKRFALPRFLLARTQTTVWEFPDGNLSQVQRVEREVPTQQDSRSLTETRAMLMPTAKTRSHLDRNKVLEVTEQDS